ncbi:MAG: hypothetical protein BWY52_01969 [Chloroflexi bacterium ADurb.Bin325]|nr:MAG: hypothetical protein BWY52_01969 [Chloroflexi bacterium ADurb.Bin325]
MAAAASAARHFVNQLLRSPARDLDRPATDRDRRARHRVHHPHGLHRPLVAPGHRVHRARGCRGRGLQAATGSRAASSRPHPRPRLEHRGGLDAGTVARPNGRPRGRGAAARPCPGRPAGAAGRLGHRAQCAARRGRAGPLPLPRGGAAAEVRPAHRHRAAERRAGLFVELPRAVCRGRLPLLPGRPQPVHRRRDEHLARRSALPLAGRGRRYDPDVGQLRFLCRGVRTAHPAQGRDLRGQAGGGHAPLHRRGLPLRRHPAPALLRQPGHRRAGRARADGACPRVEPHVRQPAARARHTRPVLPPHGGAARGAVQDLPR